MPGHAFPFGCLNDLAKIARPDREVAIELRCTRCGTGSEATVPIIAVHSAPATIRPDWDGVILPFIIVCAECGAEDEYRFEASTLVALRARAAGARLRGSVVQAELRTWDGAVPGRPIEMLRHLREIARRDPSCGEAWRRYGNALEKLGRPDEARAAWERAVEIDDNEFEAAVCLAELSHRSDADDVWKRIECALSRCAAERWRGAREAHTAARRKLGSHYAAESAEERLTIIELLLDVLEARASDDHVGLGIAWSSGSDRGAGDGKGITITLSGIDLSKLTRWDRLAEFLASDLVISAHLAAPPEERPTFLEAFLESPAPLSLLHRLPRGMRNEVTLVRNADKPSSVWRSRSKKRNRHGKTAEAR